MKRSWLLFVAVVFASAVIVTGVLAQEAGAIRASATLVDVSGNEVGTAFLVEDATGTVHVNVHVQRATPGLHGVHFHAVGACSPDFSAAGGHHNPTGAQHGLENPTGPHSGDLPNMVVNEAGNGRLVTTTDRATLSEGATSLFDADGSAIVMHASEDDQVTNPTGNSGGRVACGVIMPIQ